MIEVTGNERPDTGYQGFSPNQETLFKQKPRTAGQAGSEAIPGLYAPRIRDQRADG